MAANRTLYVLDWVRTLLATDTTLTVQKVWRPDNGNGIIAYPFILNQSFSDYDERGSNLDNGVIQLNILFSDKTQGDPAGLGLNTDAYGELIQKVEKLFDDAALTVAETHTGSLYRTRIQWARIQSWDGQFDVGDTKMNVGCLVNIGFTHTRQ